MTCRELMTANPSFCLPADSVFTAAQIMKREDVGPVLVVSSPTEKRLAGIVTDRDLALKVVAEGRDAHSTTVDEVMSPNPVTCHENDDISSAIRKMSEYQVRRIPVLDSSDRLAGIIAQADVARHAGQEDVGEMVEEISQPYGSGEWLGGHRERASERTSHMPGANAALIAALCVGVGAALMYGVGYSRQSSGRGPVRRDPKIALPEPGRF